MHGFIVIEAKLLEIMIKVSPLSGAVLFLENLECPFRDVRNTFGFPAKKINKIALSDV